MIPSYSDLEVPLLRALEKLGGKASPKQVYPLVASQFSGLTEDDLSVALKSGHSAFNNRIQWTRQRLIESAEMASGGHGVWLITDKGMRRLSGSHTRTSQAVDLAELHEQHVTLFERKMRQRLLDLSPTEFEQFGQLILEAYGFVETNVTRRGSDGGIDGSGRLRLGLATMNAAFQCKRWSGNVPRDEIDKFRGAIQGEYEQGVFFTTSDFTSGAKAASLKPGAVPIVLLNGEKLVAMMIEKQLGVTRQPLYLLSDEDLDLLLDSED